MYNIFTMRDIFQIINTLIDKLKLVGIINISKSDIVFKPWERLSKIIPFSMNWVLESTPGYSRPSTSKPSRKLPSNVSRLKNSGNFPNWKKVPSTKLTFSPTCNTVHISSGILTCLKQSTTFISCMSSAMEEHSKTCSRIQRLFRKRWL